MMTTERHKEHQWLQQLVGEWTSEGEASMAPGEPPQKWKASESVRSFGGLWTLGEGTNDMPGGGVSKSLMTLGYDPEKKRFVGTFIASVMTHLWIYDGALDESGRVLTLDSEGPDLSTPGKMAKYQDIIEFHGNSERVLRSRMLGADGNWNEFMKMTYRRV